MSVSVQLGDAVYQLASVNGWRLACAWAEALSDDYVSVKALCLNGEVTDTTALADQLENALSRHPPEAPVEHTLREFLRVIDGGLASEIATVVM